MDWRELDRRIERELDANFKDVPGGRAVRSGTADQAARIVTGVVKDYVSELHSGGEETIDEAGVVTRGMMAQAVDAYRDYGRVECEPDFEEALAVAISAAVQARPTAIRAKLVLSEQDHGEQGPEELEIMFNQGVRIESLTDRGELREELIDIATGSCIARRSGQDWMVNLPVTGGVMPVAFYRQATVHGAT